MGFTWQTWRDKVQRIVLTFGETNVGKGNGLQEGLVGGNISCTSHLEIFSRWKGKRRHKFLRLTILSYRTRQRFLCIPLSDLVLTTPPPGGGHLREVWVGVCLRGLQTLTLFKTKSVHFATLFKTRDRYILLVFCVFSSALFFISHRESILVL